MEEFQKKILVVHADSGKVHIFWEGHKILRNLHLTFDWHHIGKSKWKISQNFVAFSEYMNFRTISSKSMKGNMKKGWSDDSGQRPVITQAHKIEI